MTPFIRLVCACALLVGFAGSSLAVAAQDFWLVISRKLEAGSLANVDQLKVLYKNVVEELDSPHSNKQSLEALNVKLRALNLPEVKLENPDLQVSLTKLVGFSSAVDIGVEITDGSHKFCLPCSVGHNSYEIGITEVRP